MIQDDQLYQMFSRPERRYNTATSGFQRMESKSRRRAKCVGCVRCPDPKTAKTFAVSTTENAIDHLKSKHSIGYGGELITPGPEPHQQTIERAFSTHKPTVTFNGDDCRQLLLRWVVKMSISSRVCEDDSFPTYCSYLAACKPDYSAIYRAIPTSGNSRDEGRSYKPTPIVTLQNPLQLRYVEWPKPTCISGNCSPVA